MIEKTAKEKPTPAPLGVCSVCVLLSFGTSTKPKKGAYFSTNHINTIDAINVVINSQYIKPQSERYFKVTNGAAIFVIVVKGEVKSFDATLNDFHLFG